jgi:hypothetical protein
VSAQLCVFVQGLPMGHDDILVEFPGRDALAAARDAHQGFTVLGFKALIGHPVAIRHVYPRTRTVSVEEALRILKESFPPQARRGREQPVSACQHARVRPEVCDQTLGVGCLDCKELLAWCWSEKHVPESLWNRACANDAEAVPCEQSRDDRCAVCGEAIP